VSYCCQTLHFYLLECFANLYTYVNAFADHQHASRVGLYADGVREYMHVWPDCQLKSLLKKIITDQRLQKNSLAQLDNIKDKKAVITGNQLTI